jgi:hypothetical protein
MFDTLLGSGIILIHSLFARNLAGSEPGDAVWPERDYHAPDARLSYDEERASNRSK